MTEDAGAAAPRTIHLEDYRPPDYLIDTVALRFELDEDATVVHTRLEGRANHGPAGERRPLVLDGQDLELVSVVLDGRSLAEGEYRVEGESLTVFQVPEAFTLEVVTRIRPAANTALEGLYTSGGNFCTQCEAEGFRKITYFPDRPDVMAVYTTTLVADRGRYPVLLSNGDLIETGETAGGRHFATWHDPFPKPCYLFALVAGDLACVEDSYTTASGRTVALRIYVQHGNEDKCGHAMASLKKAMAWDERTYGREYDLDTYMIVAVDDFNMGAMENKGLNIFNSRYVLARPETATDADFVNIEGVIGHEYFHNWSGNRITCRDWFQLSLKEGFTVFRDQQFTAEMTSAAVKRIGDVGLLRTHQFQEDAGPMAHAVRPRSYVEINNFYTLTVYNKGAEVVRMLHTLLGSGGFRKGTDLYFARHDGQAVITDDFVKAMEEANGKDLGRFRRWYDQAGTPRLRVAGSYDAASKTYTLTVSQSCPPSPGQPEKRPFHIPFALGLLGRDGGELGLRLEGERGDAATSRVLELTEAEQRFVFTDIPERPVPSLLRGFSAPVKVDAGLGDEGLAFLMAHDADPFNRWDAGQQLALRVMLRLMDAPRDDWRLDGGLSGAFGRTLADPSLDRALIAQAITLPEEAYVAEFRTPVDPGIVHEVRHFLVRALAGAHRDSLTRVYEANTGRGPYRIDAAAMGRRRLRNLCLAYLAELGDEAGQARCRAQFDGADNMTDGIAALTALVHTEGEGRDEALDRFYRRWRQDPLVLDKWFAIQATAPAPQTLERVRALAAHGDFSMRNPNRVRALIGAFCQRNPVCFHDPGGQGYAFLADWVLTLDRVNPQIAARLLAPMTHWHRYEPGRRALMEEQLQRIQGAPSLSRDVYEVVAKSLARGPE